MCIFINTWYTCFHSSLFLIIYPGLCVHVLLYHRGIQHFQRGKCSGKGCIFKEVIFSSLPFQQVPQKCFLSTLLRGYRSLRKVTLGRWEAGICCWVKSFEDVIGNKFWGRITLSQQEEFTPIQIELFYYIWPKGFWALVYLLRNLQWWFIHEEIFSETYFSPRWACFHEQLSHFSRCELIAFPAPAFHTQM